MKKGIALVLGIVAITMAMEVAAFAQEEETAVTVKTTTTAKAEGRRLFGRITAPFSPRGEGAGGQDCVTGRQVEVLMKRPRGFRSVGEVRTAADGAWSQRVREFNARYRIEIDGAEFAYSPSYGQLETVRCQPALVVGWLRRGGFRIDRVLGERFGRAATAQLGAELQSGELPTTGSPITSYILAGALLIFVGAVLVRSRPVDETT